jgi:hypothetical protein
MQSARQQQHGRLARARHRACAGAAGCPTAAARPTRASEALRLCGCGLLLDRSSTADSRERGTAPVRLRPAARQQRRGRLARARHRACAGAVGCSTAAARPTRESEAPRLCRCGRPLDSSSTADSRDRLARARRRCVCGCGRLLDSSSTADSRERGTARVRVRPAARQQRHGRLETARTGCSSRITADSEVRVIARARHHAALWVRPAARQQHLGDLRAMSIMTTF